MGRRTTLDPGYRGGVVRVAMGAVSEAVVRVRTRARHVRVREHVRMCAYRDVHSCSWEEQSWFRSANTLPTASICNRGKGGNEGHA